MDKLTKPFELYRNVIQRILGTMFLVMSIIIFLDAQRVYELWESLRGQEGHVTVSMLRNRFVLHSQVPHDLVVIYAVLILLLAFSLLYISINFFSDDLKVGINWLKDRLIPKKWQKKPKEVVSDVQEVVSRVEEEQGLIERELTERFTMLDEEPTLSVLERAKRAVLSRPQKETDQSELVDIPKKRRSILSKSASEVYKFKEEEMASVTELKLENQEEIVSENLNEVDMEIKELSELTGEENLSLSAQDLDQEVLEEVQETSEVSPKKEAD